MKEVMDLDKVKSLFVKLYKKQKKAFIAWKKSQDKQHLAMYSSIALIVLFLMPYIAGYTCMLSYAAEGRYPLGFAATLSFGRYYLIGLFSFRGLGITLFLYLLGWGIEYIIIAIQSKDLNPIAETDERGVAFSADGTYGTARWMDKETAKEVFEIDDIGNVDGYILGQFGEEGKECIANSTKASGNQNYLIIASPGRGKTFCYVFNAALQALKRGESAILVDPKGEIAEATYNLFKENGYDAYVYNLVNPERSDAWNFALEILDSKTGEVGIDRLMAFVDVVITNTMSGDKEDGFWGPGERNLFQAGTAYVGWSYEQKMKANLNRALDELEKAELSRIDSEDKDGLIAIVRNEFTTIREKEQALETILRAANMSEEDIHTYIEKLREASDPITIDRIFSLFVSNDISALAQMFQDAQIPASHPAAISWSLFMRGTDKQQPGFILGLSQRLMLFANHGVNTMSAYNDIQFRRLGEKKTVIFCVIPDKDASKKLLSSLFFSFLFRDVSDAADELGPSTRLPVNVICDEFANIGVIPDFDKVISTVRSRKIYISLIIQSIAQLENRYDKLGAEVLMECCDTILFLGCNSESTANFISNLSGDATIITNSVKDQKSIAGTRGLAQGYSTSEGAGKRYLVTPAEARGLDTEEVLIYHAGCQMLKAKRCGWIWHPLHKKLPPPLPLRNYPRTVDKYGVHASAFDGINSGSLTAQRTLNAMNATLLKENKSAHPFESPHTETPPPQFNADRSNPATQMPDFPPMPPMSTAAPQQESEPKKPKPAGGRTTSTKSHDRGYTDTQSKNPRTGMDLTAAMSKGGDIARGIPLEPSTAKEPASELSKPKVDTSVTENGEFDESEDRPLSQFAGAFNDL